MKAKASTPSPGGGLPREIGLNRFCPDQGRVAGASQQLSAETGCILRSRLRMVCLLFLFGLVVFAVRGVVVGDVPLGLQIPLLVVVVAGAALLHSRVALSNQALRALELVLFASVYLRVLMTHYQLETFLAASDPTTSVALALYRVALAAIVLLAVYGTFIPNRWPRAALVATPIGLAPLLLAALLRAGDPGFGERMAGSLGAADVSALAVLCLLAVVTTVLGAHVVHSMRQDYARAQEMGLYELTEKIGQGGMGEVWKARHHLLARPAAIKLIRADVAAVAGAETARQRFEREAQVTASLRSPHTVGIYDFGVTADGAFYYIMEYLDGLALDNLVREHGPLPAARAVHLLAQAIRSLSEAHDMGLIHRDIKPSNLHVLNLGGEYDFLKVLDFGLVKVLSPQGSGPADLTAEGITTGTPAFMPPEMALGQAIDARTDVYALGCVAYWLLTGQYVFEASSAMALIVDHVKTRPIAPSARSDNPIPADLDRLILACLEKDAARRPQTMAELGERLAASARGLTWSQGQAAEWWRKLAVARVA